MEIRVDTVGVTTAIQDKCSVYTNGEVDVEVYLIVALAVLCAHVKGKASSSHLKEQLYLPDIVYWSQNRQRMFAAAVFLPW